MKPLLVLIYVLSSVHVLFGTQAIFEEHLDRDDVHAMYEVLKASSDDIDPTVHKHRALRHACGNSHRELVKLLLNHPLTAESPSFFTSVKKSLKTSYDALRVPVLIELLSHPMTPVDEFDKETSMRNNSDLAYAAWGLDAALLNACSEGDGTLVRGKNLVKLRYWQFDMLISRARHHAAVQEALVYWMVRAFGCPAHRLKEYSWFVGELRKRYPEMRTLEIKKVLVSLVKVQSLAHHQHDAHPLLNPDIVHEIVLNQPDTLLKIASGNPGTLFQAKPPSWLLRLLHYALLITSWWDILLSDLPNLICAIAPLAISLAYMFYLIFDEFPRMLRITHLFEKRGVDLIICGGIFMHLFMTIGSAYLFMRFNVIREERSLFVNYNL